MNRHKHNIDEDLMDQLEQLQNQMGQAIGYPLAKDLDYSGLEPFFKVFLNNIGDPYDNSGWFQAHSKEQERAVLQFYADLLRAPREGFWGYVTSGSTEGNLYGLYVARERYPDGVVYYSEGAHYSIAKNCHLLGMTAVSVPTQPRGEIDYTALGAALRQHRDKPAIVVATVGTTMTEARDRLDLVAAAVEAAGINRRHFHCDAALVGNYARFTEAFTPYDFAAGADTVAVSGYKFLGTPMPCGVVLCRNNLKTQLGERVAYIANPDATISGSRSGHTPLAMWYAIEQLGMDGFRQRYRESLNLAAYTERRLLSIGWQTWRNAGALTTMLAAPPQALCYKWQLATAAGWSHVICMPGVTQEHIDAFILDLQQVK